MSVRALLTWNVSRRSVATAMEGICPCTRTVQKQLGEDEEAEIIQGRYVDIRFGEMLAGFMQGCEDRPAASSGTAQYTGQVFHRSTSESKETARVYGSSVVFCKYSFFYHRARNYKPRSFKDKMITDFNQLWTGIRSALRSNEIPHTGIILSPDLSIISHKF